MGGLSLFTKLPATAMYQYGGGDDMISTRWPYLASDLSQVTKPQKDPW